MFAVFFSTLAILVTTFYLYFKWAHSYWKRRNVPSPPSRIPFGNLQSIGRRNRPRIHSAIAIQRLYAQMRNSTTDADFCGIYFFHKPAVLVLSLEMAKSVLIADFNAFQERGVYYNERDDPLSAHLFALDGARWRPMRSKLTPTFTSGRMKFMFPTIVRVAGELRDRMRAMIDSDGAGDGAGLEMKDLLGRFTTDVIGTCAFGIDCNSLRDPASEFRSMGKRVFGKPRHSVFVSILMLTFKKWARALHVKVHHDEVTEFFVRIVRETIELRESTNVRRNDFMDLLIEIKNRGRLHDGTDLGSITVEEIAAQAFVFFLAGFETTSTTLAFALYELALNDEIQTRGREEIAAVMAKHGDGELTYEAMMEMQYLDHIINETLRKYPPGANIVRMATSDYTVPGGNGVVIDSGTLVMIPVYAIHHDEAYYPDPERYDPSRFTAKNVALRPSMAFMPFGEGPRNCIGLRFGMMQARIGLIMLLQNFRFSVCDRTIWPMEFESNVVLTPKGGVYLKFDHLER